VKGLLVRIGIDHTFGSWNAQVEPASGDFVYVPFILHFGYHTVLRDFRAESRPATGSGSRCSSAV